MLPLIPFTVEIPRRLVEEFKNAAKRAFPRETFAYLIGHEAGTSVGIEELYFPDGLEKHTTEAAVNVQPHWLIDAQAHARDIEATVLGDIHSHPFKHRRGHGEPDRSPSESDIDRAWSNLYGICLVRQDKNGRLFSSIRFYSRQPEVITRIT
jgi:proteasome lid subunit RPN8/RPN11